MPQSKLRRPRHGATAPGVDRQGWGGCGGGHDLMASRSACPSLVQAMGPRSRAPVTMRVVRGDVMLWTKEAPRHAHDVRGLRAEVGREGLLIEGQVRQRWHRDPPPVVERPSEDVERAGGAGSLEPNADSARSALSWMSLGAGARVERLAHGVFGILGGQRAAPSSDREHSLAIGSSPPGERRRAGSDPRLHHQMRTCPNTTRRNTSRDRRARSASARAKGR